MNFKIPSNFKTRNKFNQSRIEISFGKRNAILIIRYRFSIELQAYKGL